MIHFGFHTVQVPMGFSENRVLGVPLNPLVNDLSLSLSLSLSPLSLLRIAMSCMAVWGYTRPCMQPTHTHTHIIPYPRFIGPMLVSDP